MKQKNVTLEHQRLRLKRHLKNSKARARRARLKKRTKLKHIDALKQTIDFSQSPILKMLKMPKNSKKTRPKMVIETPKYFCILRHPNEVLVWLAGFQKIVLTKEVNEVTIDHHNTIHYGVGAEMLLGIIANEVKKLRSLANNPIYYYGLVSNNHAHNDLINEVGVVSEIANAKMQKDASPDISKIHVFKRNSNLTEQASQTAEDLKNTTVKEFIKHIENGLRDHQLKLNEGAADDLRKCVGEVLDNVEEHCGLNTPHWWVRGYLNNNYKNKVLELTILNAGRSIADSFLELDNEHYSKKLAMDYVNLHSAKIKKNALLTIAALQGNISSKNLEEKDTRGQGTVTLIEAFEAISKGYERLRCKKLDHKSRMSLISGDTVIDFTDKYHSISIEDTDTNEERVIIPFNAAKSLLAAPDAKILNMVHGTHFSGLMINISIPLTGSLIPLGEST